MARVGDRKQTIAIVVGWSALAPEEFEANKQFIIQAVNSHYALVEALKSAPKPIPDSDDVKEWFWEYEQWHREACRQALALATKGGQ